MKRDMEVIRDILEWLEEHDHEEGVPLIRTALEAGVGAPNEVTDRHLWLCEKKGLVAMSRVGDRVGASIVGIVLTWEGHDMLEDMRSGPPALRVN